MGILKTQVYWHIIKINHLCHNPLIRTQVTSALIINKQTHSWLKIMLRHNPRKHSKKPVIITHPLSRKATLFPKNFVNAFWKDVTGHELTFKYKIRDVYEETSPNVMIGWRGIVPCDVTAHTSHSRPAIYRQLSLLHRESMKNPVLCL